VGIRDFCMTGLPVSLTAVSWRVEAFESQKQVSRNENGNYAVQAVYA